jgi:hypothetical protein
VEYPCGVTVLERDAVLHTISNVITKGQGNDSTVRSDLSGKKPRIELLDGVELRGRVVSVRVGEAMLPQSPMLLVVVATVKPDAVVGALVCTVSDKRCYARGNRSA